MMIDDDILNKAYDEIKKSQEELNRVEQLNEEKSKFRQENRVDIGKK